MSDIRFNRWLHQSGTGGVFQDGSGRVGIGSSTPTELLDIVGVSSATSFFGPLTGNVTGNVTGDITSSGTSTFDVISGVSTIGVTTVHLTGINNLSYPTAGPLSNRNLVTNGAMRIEAKEEQPLRLIIIKLVIVGEVNLVKRLSHNHNRVCHLGSPTMRI